MALADRRNVVHRPGASILAQALVAGVYALQSSPSPWLAAARSFPVCGTLIDAGCLLALCRLTRREGIALPELVSFAGSRWRRDLGLGLGLMTAFATAGDT